ncbi:YjdF family protein [Rubneribacter sp.]|nr:YjdF family protein [Candidatus Rubneribacter avistercoris]
MSLCKLTVCFEEPFWVGLIEVEDSGAYGVARHVFGTEPTTPEVFRFICDHWNDLRFTHDVQVDVGQSKRVNPKRLRRMIEKELQENSRKGTKAQQALAEQRELAKEKSAIARRRRKEDCRQERFAKKAAKRKQKHRGH